MPYTAGSLRTYGAQNARREVVTLDVVLTFTGGAYAVTDGDGVISVTDVGTGEATINLRNPYYRLMGYAAEFIPADGAGPLVRAYVSSVANIASASAPAITIKTVDAFSNDGTPADPEAGDILCLTLRLAVAARGHS